VDDTGAHRRSARHESAGSAAIDEAAQHPAAAGLRERPSHRHRHAQRLRGAQPSEATSLSIFELHYLVGRITLGQIMTHNPVTVRTDTTVSEAAQIMLKRKISGLPVLEDGQLVGIITESDIFRLVVRTWQEEPPPVFEAA
jgi:CBS domain-containing protein